MEHVVFFPAHDGTPAFRRVASLEEAVRLVEHLRNVEGVSEVSCHALTEVPLAFKAWYRVEVPTAETTAETSAEVNVEPAPLAVVPDEVPSLELPEQPVVALAGSNGHVAEAAGPSSLGFFSR